ncbi:YncE family protein [Bizionia sp.]|uniref:YncE family protein n=1 Tax=Bizionia sp. TaxID=1954480 RepID=UPI003A95426A
MNKQVKLVVMFAVVLLLQNCTSNDREIIIDNPPPSGDYANGIFVLNEGGYTYSNASVSFIDNSGQVYNNVFYGVNGRKLGDVAQSMAFYGDKAYILVNNSNTIEVVNRYTFELITTIENDILTPRYMTFDGAKGFITNWGDPADTTDDYVAVLDTETNAIISTIPVAEGPDGILNNNGTLYVAHYGGWGYGNTISVLDAVNETVTASIDVSDMPGSMVTHNNDLYVICAGKEDYTGAETLGGLYKINMATNQVTDQIIFADGVHPDYLEINNNLLLYTLNRDVYKVDLNDFRLPATPLFTTSTQNLGVLYGFTIINETIYIADAKDFVSNGDVLVYNLQGDFQENYNVKLIPNGFYNNN